MHKAPRYVTDGWCESSNWRQDSTLQSSFRGDVGFQAIQSNSDLAIPTTAGAQQKIERHDAISPTIKRPTGSLNFSGPVFSYCHKGRPWRLFIDFESTETTSEAVTLMKH